MIDSRIRLVKMSPPRKQGRWVYHNLPMMDKGWSKLKGYESTTSKIQGYMPWDDDLRKIMESLEGFSPVTVTDTTWGTSDWNVTGISYSEGTAWVQFTINLTET